MMISASAFIMNALPVALAFCAAGAVVGALKPPMKNNPVPDPGMLGVATFLTLLTIITAVRG